jgi:hypothetical protein
MTNALAKLLIEKGVITDTEFKQKLLEERAVYQRILNPTNAITGKMDMDEQTPGDDSTPQGAITQIVHDLANSANSICSTVQLLETDLNKDEGHRRYTRELIIGLKDECSRLNSHLEELRRLTKASHSHDGA